MVTMNRNKVVIVGTGQVGATAAFGIVTHGLCNELVLIDCSAAKALGEARDLDDGSEFQDRHVKVRAGDYADCKDADIVVITVGRKPPANSNRMAELGFTVGLVGEVVDNVMASGFDGVIVMVSNPVDVMAWYAWKRSGLPRTQVLGTGTALDTSRLKTIIGEETGLDPRNVGGFVMGEGSGVLVLEELDHAKARGAKIYAEVVGYGANCDAYHFTAPAPGGTGAIDCMKLTLADAGIAPEQVDHINAHGTGTHMNDSCETAAIHAVFGEHAKQLTVVSTKSMTGHLLGGAGGIEAVFTALALHDQFAPPTIHYEQPDPECDLDYVPNTGRAQAMTYALSNSLGFGGHNACIALRRWEG